FDPFAHKLVLAVMGDYLDEMAEAKAEIARLTAEKEAFEQSNPPDDADEDELASWNHAKDLTQQLKELKAENRDALRELGKLQTAASRVRATAADREALAEATVRLQPVLDELAELEAALAPHEQMKTDLSAARARYRELVGSFLVELRLRCGGMPVEEQQALVLRLLAEDAEAGLLAAVAGRRQEVVGFVERLWDKYRVALDTLTRRRTDLDERLAGHLGRLGYA
ncbi:MAG: hypothetical protein COZ06_22855, partial [Armatimonadetes bacterium CG_4_10_14_3_um_filter_66_18]